MYQYMLAWSFENDPFVFKFSCIAATVHQTTDPQKRKNSKSEENSKARMLEFSNSGPVTVMFDELDTRL